VRILRGAAVSALVAMATLGMTHTAFATTVEVDVGADGALRTIAPIPVHITIKATKAIDGRLTITSRSGPSPSSVTVPFNAAANTTSDVWVAISVSPFGDGLVKATVTQGSREIASTSEIPAFGTVDEIVGVLPDLVTRAGTLPATVAVAVTEFGVARLARLDTKALELGSGPLSNFGSIAGTNTDLAQLSPVALRSLLMWLERGGTLLLDEKTAANTTQLPSEWRPGASGYVNAGVGEVRLTTGQLQAGKWAQNIVATPKTSAMFAPQSPLTQMNFGFDTSVPAYLAREARVTQPSLGTVIPMLLVYAVIAGPLLFFVLKRTHRLTLAWGIIPVLAVATSAVIVVGSSSLRRSTRGAHATVQEDATQGSSMSTSVLARSGSDGDVGLTMKDQWWASSNASFQGGPQNGVSAVFDLDRQQLTRSQGPGLLGITDASGDLANAGGLTVSAVSDSDGRVNGIVTNNSDRPLRHVAVFAGTKAVLVGDLAAGASGTYSLTELAKRDQQSRAITTVWKEAVPAFVFGQNGATQIEVDTTSDVVSALWMSAMIERGDSFLPVGTVAAAGFRADVGPARLTNGDALTNGRTMVFTRARVAAGSKGLTDMTIRRIDVQSSANPAIKADNNAPTQPLISRFVVDSSADVPTDGLVIVIPKTVLRAVVWDGKKWIRLPDVNGDRVRIVRLPASTLRDGQVIVRSDIDMNIVFNPGEGVTDEFVIRPSRAGDTLAALPAQGAS
jgi:hypothetical protein